MRLKLFYILILFFGCNTNNEGLNLNLQIEGLKKGEIIIKKLSDSAFVSLDSFQINGNNKINFKYMLAEPEMIYLDLNLNDGSSTKTMNFFAENSKIDIKTSLENYGFNMSVKGSINDSIYRNYISFNKKFNNQKLDLYERSFKNIKSNNKDSLEIIENLIININTRQFLHNANYAVRNSTYEVAPYIAITDLYESKKILDTIYKSLDEKIIGSKYGVQLKKWLNN
tara:strand:- start:153 stop:830 length:678 start_codon:yes stop_codon:yes gene_type:complete